MSQNTPYDGIIPTGWMTAYSRITSKIPYSKEVFEELELLHPSNDAVDLDAMKDNKLAPQFEARNKLLDRLIRSTGVKQILEVAAGLSSRGLYMTEDKSVKYVELDLPKMADDKKQILASLYSKGVTKKRDNLVVESGSAVDLEDLRRSAGHFQHEPVVVVNEGLLRYLNFDDKTRYANNVKDILTEFGGYWITCDISVPKVYYMEGEIMRARRNRTSQITGIKIDNNLFRDQQHAEQFFGDLGFSVEVHSFLEVKDELVTPEELGFPDDYVKVIIENAVCFVMRLKQPD